MLIRVELRFKNLVITLKKTGTEYLFLDKIHAARYCSGGDTLLGSQNWAHPLLPRPLSATNPKTPPLHTKERARCVI